MQYGKVENNYFLYCCSFIRGKNRHPFCFYCNFSTFVSRFQRSHTLILSNFFEQGPLPSRCSYTYVKVVTIPLVPKTKEYRLRRTNQNRGCRGVQAICQSFLVCWPRFLGWREELCPTQVQYCTVGKMENLSFHACEITRILSNTIIFHWNDQWNKEI